MDTGHGGPKKAVRKSRPSCSLQMFLDKRFHLAPVRWRCCRAAELARFAFLVNNAAGHHSWSKGRGRGESVHKYKLRHALDLL